MNEQHNSGQFSYQTTSLSNTYASVYHGFPHKPEYNSIFQHKDQKTFSEEVTCFIDEFWNILITPPKN